MSFRISTHYYNYIYSLILPCTVRHMVRGTGTAVVEANLSQQLAVIKTTSLFQIFLDLQKACYALDRGRCL